jgi:hypothetical protein
MSTNMTQIDEGFIQYPVPGVDNNSQGFRDRYSIIRSNLNIAREEISLLNANTAKVNTNNNFDGNKIINANLNTTTLEANTSGASDPITDDTYNILWSGGAVHVLNVGDSINPLALTFSSWPTQENRYAKITVILLKSAGAPRDAVWPTSKKQIPAGENTITADGSLKIFEVFTYDAGNTLFVNYIGQFE